MPDREHRRGSRPHDSSRSRRSRAADGYAPFELDMDAASLGLRSTEVSNELGTCVARHRPARASTRATVFLHGAAGSWTTWTPLLRAADAAGTPFADPVLLDLPGWGDARMTHDTADVTVEAIGSLVAAAMDELGYTEWDLVGHSLGGFVGMHMASIWPDRVTSVSMVSATTFSIIAGVDHPLRNFSVVPGFTMLWRIMQLLSPFGSVAARIATALEPTGLMRVIFAPLYRHGLWMPRSTTIATAHELRPRSFAAAARVARGYDARAAWSGVRCPVAQVKGDRDVFVTDADLDAMRGVLPHSVGTVIADCGHFAHVERPFAVLASLGLPRALGEATGPATTTVEP
ncbi:alpha/beta fold hydrolase [Marisediminicola senii]|uniref:alpha/beta fold hydrolase n=1 Tax=Marisediminicola senii TaxID=2711233 RepID=UPI0013EE17FA|nr:alpha/beta hydrolase [Marisediminicola senii]